jgi:RimJ/RimL family protein N-acetyltransferase
MADLGYWLLPEHRGQGLATRAVLRLARHAFSRDGIVRLQAVVEPWNAPSIGVLARAGGANRSRAGTRPSTTSNGRSSTMQAR